MNNKSKTDNFDVKYFSDDSIDNSDSEVNFDDNLNDLLKNFYSEWKSCNVYFDSKEDKIKSLPENETKNSAVKKQDKPENKESIKPETNKFIHKNHRKRVRNKFLKYGLETFTDIEVLELLLYYAIPQKDTNEIAHKLIDEFGSLKNVLNAEYYDLMEVSGISEVSASLIVLQREITKYVNTKEYISVSLSNSYISGRFCCDYFKSHVEESFVMFFLDSHDNIENVVVISNGVENETAYYPRRVFKQILRHRTCNILLAHNHPGDVAEPSTSDIVATSKLIFALTDLGVTVKDHIICAGDKYVSFADRGLLDIKSEGLRRYLEE